MQVSEQGLRKILYQKIVAAFPEGWMSSGQISRDGVLQALNVDMTLIIIVFSVSSMKKKFEKEAMENES
jgi:hypothetical protein